MQIPKKKVNLIKVINLTFLVARFFLSDTVESKLDILLIIVLLYSILDKPSDLQR